MDLCTFQKCKIGVMVSALLCLYTYPIPQSHIQCYVDLWNVPFGIFKCSTNFCTTTTTNQPKRVHFHHLISCILIVILLGMLRRNQMQFFLLHLVDVHDCLFRASLFLLFLLTFFLLLLHNQLLCGLLFFIRFLFIISFYVFVAVFFFLH